VREFPIDDFLQLADSMSARRARSESDVVQRIFNQFLAQGSVKDQIPGMPILLRRIFSEFRGYQHKIQERPSAHFSKIGREAVR
jgi:hypothetical protein